MHLVTDLIEYSPSSLFLSSALPAAFQSTLSSLTLLRPDIVMAALDAIRGIVGHESLQSNAAVLAPNSDNTGAAIRAVIEATSAQLVELLVSGLVDGPEDASSSMVTVLRLLSIMFAPQLAATVPEAIANLQSKSLSDEESTEFLSRFTA